MQRSQWIALAALLLTALLVGWLLMRNRQAPMIPADIDHASVTQPLDCLQCHGPAGIYPRDKNHPLGDECARCHGVK